MMGAEGRCAASILVPGKLEWQRSGRRLHDAARPERADAARRRPKLIVTGAPGGPCVVALTWRAGASSGARARCGAELRLTRAGGHPPDGAAFRVCGRRTDPPSGGLLSIDRRPATSISRSRSAAARRNPSHASSPVVFGNRVSFRPAITGGALSKRSRISATAWSDDAEPALHPSAIHRSGVPLRVPRWPE